MRPRLLHLGYLGCRASLCRMGMRFNEAEAFTPRIPGLAGQGDNDGN